MADTIGDFLTQVRNSIMAKKRVVDIPASNMRKSITKILYDKGYILNFKFEDKKPQGNIKIALKYDYKTGTPAISALQRFSTPGLRKYAKAKSLPKVYNGLGVAVVSTPSGVMTDKEARKLNVGGELVCYIY